jgi:hypothetical protein
MLAPEDTGWILLDRVAQWHDAVSTEQRGTVVSAKSYYLALQWEQNPAQYQLFQFPIGLPNADTLSWRADGRRLIAEDEHGCLIEWYGHSGGQLKYYPFAKDATWSSDIFELEPLPENDEGYGLGAKIISYFPEQWQKLHR